MMNMMKAIRTGKDNVSAILIAENDIKFRNAQL